MQVGDKAGRASCLDRASEDLETLPASSQGRARLVSALRGSDGSLAPAVAALEASLPLTLAVLRTANSRRRLRGEVSSVPSALRALGAGTVVAAAESLPVYDVLETSTQSTAESEQLRLHAASVRAMAERLERLLELEPSDDLRAVAVLHDVGKALLTRAFGERALSIHRSGLTPEAAVQRERDELGIDHAAAGGWLMRRWGLPDRLAESVEAHHRAGATGHAAVIRLADMLVNYAQARAVDLDELGAASTAVGLGRDGLSALMYDLPDPFPAAPRRTVSPCPLSERELHVLRLLAQGKVYKQIAQELELSPSTVRSHLHRIYRRMNVADRTQAVLRATELDWI